MADSVYKVIELAGTSTDSWERAAGGRGDRPGVVQRSATCASPRSSSSTSRSTRTARRRTGRSSACRSSTRVVPEPGCGAPDDGSSDTLPGRWTSATRPTSSSSGPSSAPGSPTSCPASAPSRSEDWDARRAWDTGWQRMLFDAGYTGINWPKEFGGRGATPTEHLIFIEETERARAPYVGMNFVGLLHAGPTLMAEASEEQKAFHLPGDPQGRARVVPRVLANRTPVPTSRACAPGRARRRRLRDQGQKIWTSYGHVADYCEMLVRTDPEAPKHRGITWLIVPMDTPGIDVRPLPDDGGHHRVLRGLLRRRPRAGRQPGRGRERRLAGRQWSR